MTIDADILESAARQIHRCRSTARAIEILASETPRIYSQLEEIREVPEVLEFWGNSYNFDENARQIIVNPKVLKAIGAIANWPLEGSPCHSGLLHTYGYLFSVIDTPYGMKRDRWLQPKIARGVGLPSSLFSPQPARGSLLLNLTYFIGSVVYRSDARMQRKLKRLAPWVAEEIAEFDYTSLAIARVVDSTRLSIPQRRTIRLTTDLFPLKPPRRTQKTRSQLLVYSTRDGWGDTLLSTTFDVNLSHAESLLDPDENAASLVRPKYNCAIVGFTEPQEGARQYTDP